MFTNRSSLVARKLFSGVALAAVVVASAVAPVAASSGPGATVEGAASPPNTKSQLYLYNQGNGVVQTSPRVYLILWGDWSSKGDPYALQTRLYQLYNGLGNTSWGTVLTQYQTGCTKGTWNCTGAHAGNPANPYKGYWKDTRAVPTTPTQSQIAAEAARAAVAFGDYSYNAQYVIALPTGHGDTQFAGKGGSDCAWHSWTSVNGSWVTYTALPYQTDANNCYAYSVNGLSGRLDGVTLVASHEYAESVTNPGTNAWYDNDSPGQENGDKCSGYGANLKLSNGYTFPIQMTWSNYHRYYYGAGCRLGW